MECPFCTKELKYEIIPIITHKQNRTQLHAEVVSVCCGMDLIDLIVGFDCKFFGIEVDRSKFKKARKELIENGDSKN